MALCDKCRKKISDRATKCRYCYMERIPSMREEVILSSTNSFEGFEIIEYFDIAYGEVVCPNGILGAITNGTFFTISALTDARRKALDSLRQSAQKLGANAVVNVDIDISDLNGQGILVSANGTPVHVIPKDYLENRQRMQEMENEIRKREEELQQKRNEAIHEKMNVASVGNEEYSVFERNIVKIILKEGRSSVSNVFRSFKNVDPATYKEAINKLVNNGIIEIDEFGVCQVKIEIQ